jgi:hypothetical protein
MRAVALAAAVAWAGLRARSPDAADQPVRLLAAPEDEALESVATRTRLALETLVADAEKKVRACEDGCTKDESQKLAAQLHRYETAMEQMQGYANTTVLNELHASRAVEADAAKRVANLRAVLSGTTYTEDMLKRQEESLTEQIAQVKADEKTTIRSLGQAERKLLAAQSDVQDKMNSAEVWATEIRSIERAAQLGDQYAEAMYASGIEKHSEAEAKEKRAKDLLRRADKLADRIDEHLSPPRIVHEEQEKKPSSEGWGTFEIGNLSLSNVSRDEPVAPKPAKPAEQRAEEPAEQPAVQPAEPPPAERAAVKTVHEKRRVPHAAPTFPAAQPAVQPAVLHSAAGAAPPKLRGAPQPASHATDSRALEAPSLPPADDDDDGPDRLFESSTEDDEMAAIDSELREAGAEDISS